MDKVNVLDKFKLFSDHWNPKVAGELNGQQIKLVRFLGEFVWHHHDKEDEFFYVVKGKFKMHFKDKILEVCENEFLIVPHGVEHKSVADEEVCAMVFEPKTTINTGNVENELTQKILDKL